MRVHRVKQPEEFEVMTPAAQRGTTLVELVIGTILALVVLGGIVTILVSNSNLRRTDDEVNIAFRVCRAKIEELRSLDFATLPAQDGVGFEVGGGAPEYRKLKPAAGDIDGYPGEISVQMEDASGTESIYRVTTKVIWSGTAPRREFTLSCLLADRRRRK